MKNEKNVTSPLADEKVYSKFRFSLSKAIELAKEIAKVNLLYSFVSLLAKVYFIYQFPQECMLRDRASAWHATYSSPNFQEAVEHEMSNSLAVIAQAKFTNFYRF